MMNSERIIHLEPIKRLEPQCDHVLRTLKYDPSIVLQFSEFEAIKEGSNIHYRLTGYRRVRQKKRWSQTCEKCGAKFYFL